METNVDKEETGATKMPAHLYSAHDTAQLADVRKKFRKVVKGMKRKELEAMQRWLTCSTGIETWFARQLDKALKRKARKSKVKVGAVKISAAKAN